MNHIGTSELQTKRLILRKYRVDDALAMFEGWANDSRVTQYLTWKPHKSVQETKELLDQWVAEYENIDTYHWVIEEKSTNKIVGDISIVRIDEKLETVELGYCLGYGYWNKEIMSESVKAVIDYLFAIVGCNRIVAKHQIANTASGRVMQKAGLKREGVLRDSGKNNDHKYVDLVHYSILRKDWSK